MPTNIMVEARTEVGMAQVGVDDLEKLQSLKLDTASQTELVNTASECTFIFNSASGWPGGVVMSFLFHEGRYWLTAVADRTHARAVVSDPRVTLVISNAGTRLPGRRMLSIRGIAFLHRDEETKAWFYPAFTRKLAPNDPQAFQRLLDSPNRVIVEVRPVAVAVSHDSRKLPGDGRGGPAPAPTPIASPETGAPSTVEGTP
jgi:hypothetical protein